MHGESGTFQHRRIFIVVESVVALGAIVGTWQLVTETNTPPIDDLDALGLTTWTLPGLWLFLSVALPSSVAAWLAWRKSVHAPTAVLVASVALLIELAVQIPFVGVSPFQPVFGIVAIVMALLALRA